MMFKIIFLSCLWLVAFPTISASVYTERYFTDPAHPGKCTIQNKIVKPGETIKHPVMSCGEFTCDNANGLATIASCDPVTALASPLAHLQCHDRKELPNCIWGEYVDTTQEFPKCCKRKFTCT